MTKTPVKVSVIVPVYKVEEYIRKGLDSLAGQTLKDIEIICIDDGSPDNSGKICDEYAAKDARFKVIHQKNAGAGAARNAGLAAASGEYVGFMDPDDSVETDFFEKLYARAVATDADIAKGEAFEASLPEKRRFVRGPSQRSIRANRANFNHSFWSAIYRRAFLIENKIDFPISVLTGQDVVFLTKAALLANKIELVPGTHYVYLKRPDSLDSEYLDDGKIWSRALGASMAVDFINGIKTDKKTYNAAFSQWMDRLGRKVFHRNNSPEMKTFLARSLIELYEKCKYPDEFAKRNPFTAKLLADKNETDLLAHLMRPPRTDYKLFGLVPFLSIKNKGDRQAWRLFGFFPLAVAKYKADGAAVLLFGVLPVLKEYTKG